MSNADTRAAIAAALDTVDGVRGHVRQPAAPKAGSAWPTWGGGTRTESTMGFDETWRVTVVCPGSSTDAADAYVDERGPALLEALSAVLFVDSYAPARLDVEAGTFYALVITGRSE